MLAMLAAATVAASSPSGPALSPAEAMIQRQTTRQILANPAKYCREPKRAQAATSQPVPLRCRPAPYYVSARDGKTMPRILLEMKGGAMLVLDKRGQPCHLMMTPKESTLHVRVASRR